jgi:hypothetical protein
MGLLNLLRDASFTGTLVLPLVLMGLVFLASGSGIVMLFMFYVRANLPLAFTPGFIQTVVLALLLLTPVVLLGIAGFAYLSTRQLKDRPIYTPMPVINQLLGNMQSRPTVEIEDPRFLPPPGAVPKQLEHFDL